MVWGQDGLYYVREDRLVHREFPSTVWLGTIMKALNLFLDVTIEYHLSSYHNIT